MNTRELSRPRTAAGLALTILVLAGATASGAILFAVAESGSDTFSHLVTHDGIPAAVLVLLAPVVAVRVAGSRLLRATLLGGVAGLVSTIGLEAVRETGFRVFNSMPGDITMLMGVQLKNQIMQGPDLASNLAGWGDHFWNGAMFGVIYAVLLGGFPPVKRVMPGIVMGVMYGLILGTGFLISPVPVAVGAGHFGVDFGARFAVTVYLAHALFGAILGLLVHQFGRTVGPIWEPILDMLHRKPGAHGRPASDQDNNAVA